MALYRWNGSDWIQVGSTVGSQNDNVLFISAALTGRFAILGPTYPVYLPSILRV